MIGPADFRLFSPLHAYTVILVLTVCITFAWLGRRLLRANSAVERRLRLGWVVSVIGSQVLGQLWLNLGGRFDPQRTLPLHICDLVPWIGVLALFGSRRWPRALLYFWGAGLSTWAFVLPVLRLGPAHVEFWLFWGAHTQITASMAYVFWVDGYRPTPRDLRTAVAWTLAYAAIIIPVDVLLPADYGNFGRRSAAELLGPWPARIPILVIGEILIMALLLAPWIVARRHAVASRSAPS